MTNYESEFFRITESLFYEFNEDLALSFDTYNDELIANIAEFKAEITANIESKNQVDREFYLNRILKRLNESIGITILKNKKTGREHPYLQSTFESIERVETKKTNELEIYFRLSNDYKMKMANFITQLIEQVTKIPDQPEAKEGTPDTLDFTELLSRIKFDKDYKTRSMVEVLLSDLQDTVYFKKTNRKEFAAIASIFYQTGWVTNTNTFKDWLSIFSEAFGRVAPAYKQNQVKVSCGKMKIKIPFLADLPIK